MGREIVQAEEDVQTWYSSSYAPPTPLLSLNHVSFVCKSVPKSVKFYEDVLGLFNYGVGIHLLESEDHLPPKKEKINPKDNHISFQCSDLELVKRKLESMNIEYVSAIVTEGGINVDQLFFHDPDGYMIEMCNCENLPVLPLSSCPIKLPSTNRNQPAPPPLYEKKGREYPCAIEVAAMLENLVMHMLDISI